MSRKQKKLLEYNIYFALIFILAMPFSIVKWAYRLLVPSEQRKNLNIYRRSIEQASMFTPMIFQSR